MNKAIPLSCHSPEFKGISALNIIYEAGNEDTVNLYINAASDSSDNRPR